MGLGNPFWRLQVDPLETIFVKAGFLVESGTVTGTRKPTRSQQPKL